MKRRVVIAGAVVLAVVASGATIAVVGLDSSGGGQSPAESKSPAQTAKVARTTLTDTTTADGTLGYGDPTPVSTSKPGTLTWMPEVGDTVTRGHALYKVDQKPVPVLYGTLPVYRKLKDGVSGADVEEVERNLHALGYTGFVVNDDFTAATADALKRFQDDRGLDDTGTLSPGDVVIAPEAVRVADRKATLGTRVGGGGGGGPVLTYEQTSHQASVELDVSDQDVAKKGAEADVKLPDGDTVTGKITEVATEQPSSDDNSGQSTPKLKVTVAITDDKKVGDLDTAAVDVTFSGEKRSGVLAVPVEALLALAEGGYGVDVVHGHTTKTVAVHTGLFAGGKVEISGGGVKEGDSVVVASS